MSAVIEHDTRRDVAERAEPLSEQTVLLQVIARAAQDTTIDLDRMERLMVMHERMVAKRAEQEFIAAMAKFKETAPQILKDKHVHFDHRDGGGNTDYYHATLGGVVSAVVSGLGKVGLSHTWELDQGGAKIKVTCVLTHTGSHSTRTTMDAAPDASGKKNQIQQCASAISYLQRYTLLAATGLATQDMDDDGNSAGEDAGHGAQETVAPAGYSKWRADMGALADEGTDKLQAAWAGSAKDFRVHAVTHDGLWWASVKGKAGKVGVAS